MRLRKLSLDRFGHFTDQHIDFGEATDTPDFHIIYGPNEAGKTTTMEAALRLLYGFPTRESYAFKHQRANLQVSGILEISNQLKHFIRLSKRNGSLHDEQGVKLPETALTTHLAGLSLDDYRKLLCLDDDTIERGGDEIAQAEGDIGKLLFSAAAGVADLSTVLTEVSESANQLWKQRATKTRVAVLKRDLKEVEDEIKQLDISANKWRNLKKHHTDTLETVKKTRAISNERRSRLSQIEAKLRTLPKLREIDDLHLRIQPFAAFPAQLDFEPEELVNLQSDESTLQADIERLTNEIKDTQAKIKNLKRNPKLAGLAVQLDDLDDLRARDATATQDIERQRRENQNQLSLMQNAARDISADDKTDPHSLVVSAADIERLAGLRETFRTAIKTLDTETNEVAELKDRRDSAKATADDVASQSTKEPVVSNLLDQFDIEHLSPAYSSAQQSIATVEQAATRAIEALTTGQTKFGSLPTPTISKIKAQEWHDRHSELTRKISETEGSLADHLEEAEARSAQLKKMESDLKLLSEAKADSLKKERDQLWQNHKDALTDKTARNFEGAMQAHDVATESRIAHSSELGQLRQIDQSFTEATARTAKTKENLAALNKDKTSVADEVNQAVAALGITTTLTPAELLQWMKNFELAVEKSKDVKDQKRHHQPAIDRMQQLHGELCSALNESTSDIYSVMSKARTIAGTEKETTIKLKSVNDKLSDAEQELATRKKKLEKAQAAKQDAEDAWSAQIIQLFGHSNNRESLLQTLEPLRALRENSDQYQRTAQRIEAMEQDQAQFQKELDALCDAHQFAKKDSARDTFQNLREQFREAIEIESKASSLNKQLEKAKEDLGTRTRELKQLGNRVNSIASIFPAGVAAVTLPALRTTATGAKQAISDRNECKKLEREIADELGVNSITEAREVLSNTTMAELNTEADNTKAELEIAAQQTDQAIEARTLAEKALSDVSGGNEIATLIERKATIELQLEDAAMQYLTLTLGHTLANSAIHRYKDDHRSGMMAATENCFATLTQGAYPKLITEPDGGKETLLAVDKEGTSKRVDALSKGTRFQLYLALRAAAHEQMVSQGTSLPFFCDDIFETFDEDRTSAACKVMEQIGQSGQAIYLTHHQHVIDIALKVCRVAPQIHKI